MNRENAQCSPERGSPERGSLEPGQLQPAGRPRPHNRPLQAISTLVLALAAAVAVHLEGLPLRVTTASQAVRLHVSVSIGMAHLITIGGTAAFCVFALISTFAFARWARSVLERFIGAAYGAIVRYVMILLGICIVLLVALAMLGFRVGQLVVGGAVTGVLLTIAAQQSLSNVFAGVMLQFAHPFRVGDLVRIRAGALSGVIEGTVTEFSITYVRLETGEGPVLLPNAQVLSAAVSPLRALPEAAAQSPPTGQDPAPSQGMAALAEGMAALAKDMAAVAQATVAGPGGAAAGGGDAPAQDGRPRDGGSHEAGQS